MPARTVLSLQCVVLPGIEIAARVASTELAGSPDIEVEAGQAPTGVINVT
jgi:hypothetical protein